MRWQETECTRVRRRARCEERRPYMNLETFRAQQQYVETPSGQISYVENGTGNSLAALFVHGVLLNGYLWRHQLTGLGDTRRCIAVDLHAHGLRRARQLAARSG